MVRRALVAFTGLALAACATAGGGSSAAGEAAQASPEQVAQAFLDAIVKGDLDTVATKVAYPLMWDSKCRFLASEAELRQRLADNPVPEGKSVTTEVLGRLVPEASLPTDLPDWDRGRLRSSLRKYIEGACEGDAAAPFEGAKQGQLVYLHTLIVVNGSRAPTVLRLKKTGQGWRVTGLDN